LGGKNNSLPRRFSLKSRVEISHLLRFGQRYPGTFCTLVYLPDDQFKYGIFLTRRHGSAAERNRIKRLFREAIRLEVRPRLKQGKFGVLPELMEASVSGNAIRSDVRNILDDIIDDK
jgi:ribonuclease P protein component